MKLVLPTNKYETVQMITAL